MRNTAPAPPIEQRETSELIEDLCIALRKVGGCWFPVDDDRAPELIGEVQQIHAELLSRQVDVSERISRLSEETSWQMQPLLRECIEYPKAVPYVRDRDGVRRSFRCPICNLREVPDREGIWLCDLCLAKALVSVQNRIPSTGLVLFRTYNESKRCKHADADTVLITFDDEYDYDMGNSFCGRCIFEEQQRRVMR
jgi:hypothetical protein